MNHHYVQLGYQLADSVSGFAYSFVGTSIILFLMNLIPGLSLRATEEQEILGIDDAEIGEFAVRASPFRLKAASFWETNVLLQYDFVELTREVVTDTSDGNSKYSGDHAAHEKAFMADKP